jgi:hypothetical protein
MSDKKYRKAMANASSGTLPWDSPDWALSYKDGWTVAHTAAMLRNLPKGFKNWALADKN